MDKRLKTSLIKSTKCCIISLNHLYKRCTHPEIDEFIGAILFLLSDYLLVA